MSKEIKLTSAQAKLLTELRTLGHPFYVWVNYPPAKVLVKLGFARWVGDKLALTEKGRDQ